jgi:PAS domain-containing protein
MSLALLSSSTGLVIALAFGLAGCAWALVERARAAASRHVLSAAPDLKAALDAMPVPAWIRGRDAALLWGNRAFLSASGAATLAEALKSDAKLIQSEGDLVASVLEGGDIGGIRRYAVIDGRRQALSVDLMRLPGGQVAGIALDVTPTAQAQAQLRLTAEAQTDLMNRLDTAVAVFGADRRLASYNRLFARMWNLPEAWLDGRPALEDIFDRLRADRRLPERRDFSAWKKEHLDLFESADTRLDEAWHIPGGNSVRLRAYPYLLGGVFYLFEDISETLRLTATMHTMQAIERATLDTIADGLAVFGPSGELKTHNTAFARLWSLSEEELSAEPHLAQVAALCAERIGRDSIWSMVAAGLASADPAHYGDWGRITRADGRILSLSLTRLPLGATLVTFEDKTDLERFSEGLGGQSEVA